MQMVTPLPAPQRLTIVTDHECELCRQCQAWLSEQTLHVPIEFLAVGSPEALRRYESMGNRRDILIVADEYGRIWSGPSAFIMCLWATVAYRGWSQWAAKPGWRVLARTLFSTVSSNRHRLADLMDGQCADESCSHQPEGEQYPNARFPSATNKVRIGLL